MISSPVILRRSSLLRCPKKRLLTKGSALSFLYGRARLICIRAEDATISAFVGMGQSTRFTGVGQLTEGGRHHDALLMPTCRIGTGQGCQEGMVVHVSSFLNHDQARQAWDSDFSGLLLHTRRRPGAGPVAYFGVRLFSARLLQALRLRALSPVHRTFYRLRAG